MKITVPILKLMIMIHRYLSFEFALQPTKPFNVLWTLWCIIRIFLLFLSRNLLLGLVLFHLWYYIRQTVKNIWTKLKITLQCRFSQHIVHGRHWYGHNEILRLAIVMTALEQPPKAAHDIDTLTRKQSHTISQLNCELQNSLCNIQKCDNNDNDMSKVTLDGDNKANFEWAEQSLFWRHKTCEQRHCHEDARILINFCHLKVVQMKVGIYKTKFHQNSTIHTHTLDRLHFQTIVLSWQWFTGSANQTIALKRQASLSDFSIIPMRRRLEWVCWKP